VRREERGLDGLEDEQLLRLATEERRPFIILDVLSRELQARPAQAQWTELTLFITRAPAGDE
jgi:hypothetical protein